MWKKKHSEKVAVLFAVFFLIATDARTDNSIRKKPQKEKSILT